MLVVDQDQENGGVYRLTFEGEAPCLLETDRMQILNNGSVCFDDSVLSFRRLTLSVESRD